MEVHKTTMNPHNRKPLDVVLDELSTLKLLEKLEEATWYKVPGHAWNIGAEVYYGFGSSETKKKFIESRGVATALAHCVIRLDFASKTGIVKLLLDDYVIRFKDDDDYTYFCRRVFEGNIFTIHEDVSTRESTSFADIKTLDVGQEGAEPSIAKSLDIIGRELGRQNDLKEIETLLKVASSVASSLTDASSASTQADIDWAYRTRNTLVRKACDKIAEIGGLDISRYTVPVDVR